MITAINRLIILISYILNSYIYIPSNKKMSGDAQTKTIPIYIDSNDRDPGISTSATDFTTTLHKTLRNVRRIDIASVELTHSWYNVDSNNNTLLLAVFFGGVEGLLSPSIPVGEYNVESLRVAIQLALNSLGGFPTTSTVTFNALTYKYTINTPFQAYIFSSGYLSEMMGIYIRPFAYSFSTTSNGIVTTIPHKYLFIKSSALANNINTSYVSSVNKYIVITAANNTLAILVPSISSTLMLTLVFPYLGSYTTDQLILILGRMLNYPPGFFGSTAWSVSFDHSKKKVTISNGTLPFYITSNDTMASTVFNIPRSTTNIAALKQTGDIIDFSMHKNVIAKIRVSNTIFATQHVFDVESFKQENDYGKRLDLNALDFQVVDAYDRVINLNGKGVSFTLLVSSNT
jgi:hypothetical protein